MTELEKINLIKDFMTYELSLNKRNLPEQYDFLNDWNWLIEALKKFDCINATYLTIGEWQAYTKHCDDIDATLLTYDITDTINALCDGIEWYNSTIN